MASIGFLLMSTLKERGRWGRGRKEEALFRALCSLDPFMRLEIIGSDQRGLCSVCLQLSFIPGGGRRRGFMAFGVTTNTTFPLFFPTFCDFALPIHVPDSSIRTQRRPQAHPCVAFC